MYAKVFILLAIVAQATTLGTIAATSLSTIGKIGLKAVAGIGLLKLAGRYLGGSHNNGYGYGHGYGNGYGLNGLGSYGAPSYHVAGPKIYHHQSDYKKTYVQQPQHVYNQRPHLLPYPQALPISTGFTFPQAQLKKDKTYNQPSPMLQAQPLSARNPPVVHSPLNVVQQNNRQKRSVEDVQELEQLFQEIESINAEECLKLITCQVMVEKEQYADLYESISSLLDNEETLANFPSAKRYTEAANLGMEASEKKDYEACQANFHCSASYKDLLAVAKEVYNI